LNSVTVIVPTLNESENIDILLRRLLTVKSTRKIDFDILFVDSASTDNTCDCVKKWHEPAGVELLSLDKNVGLAGAVIAAVRKAETTFVLVMDADLSHPPEAIPDLLRPLFESTHDMVIGSRYVEGGSTPDWPFSRRISSKIATIPALFFCDVHDPLAGFFAVQRKRLLELSCTVPGFKIGLAVLAEYGKELRVKEIPIEFSDRDFGESKMNRGVAFDYLKQLVILSTKRLRKRQT